MRVVCAARGRRDQRPRRRARPPAAALRRRRVGVALQGGRRGGGTRRGRAGRRRRRLAHLRRAPGRGARGSAHLVPYVYTALYEGGERTPGVFLTGEVPSRQLLPAMQWLHREHGVRRWCIVGNDYVWPRATARAARVYAQLCGGEICHEVFAPLGCRSWEPIVGAVGHSRAGCGDHASRRRGRGAVQPRLRRRRTRRALPAAQHAHRREHARRQRRREHSRHLRRGGLLRDAGHAREPRLRVALHAPLRTRRADAEQRRGVLLRGRTPALRARAAGRQPRRREDDRGRRGALLRRARAARSTCATVTSISGSTWPRRTSCSSTS